ncbi:STAS domain-containing protein [Nonomuraea africana]|uniref:Anti-sigma factor antagonist n=1 Tax=Nonomuraea africana TaxID=46171 RepID=A0ABR9KRC7_9ACTN|nr:STAS domain-containing protein [Nonomuraea africana]MBE1564564.1 anti-sigma B factor antagonist [Nonomuraea africana]
MADLTVVVERSAGAAIVRLRGDLDKLSAPVLRDQLVLLHDERVHTIVVDATELAFCDSSGLWVLIEHQRLVREHGGDLRLTGVHGVLRRVLDVTGLSAVFT